MKRILDTSGIDIDNRTIRSGLYTDLLRMNKLTHDRAPENADAYTVTVTPSPDSYMPGFHRFRFEIQYGKSEGDGFTPIGEPVRYESETLPFLD